MMYLPKIIDNEGLYFKNVISESKYLIRLIEELDLNKDTHNSISKWENLNENLKFKKFLDIENLKNEKQKQNILYVRNSFLYSAIYCISQYSQIYKKQVGQLKNIYLFKSKADKNFYQEFNANITHKTISCYIILNPEINGMPFCLDKKNNSYIQVEPDSLIMVSDKFEHSIGANKDKDLYFAKFKFEIDPETIRCSNLI